MEINETTFGFNHIESDGRKKWNINKIRFINNEL